MNTNHNTKSSPQYGIVVPVPARIGRQLLPVRERWLRLRKHNPAHITVVYPFPWHESEEALCRITASVCRDVPVFTACLDKVASFPGANVIFLQIADGGRLHQLHRRLLEALALREDHESRFRAFERDNYRPHITLGADLSQEDFCTAWSEIKDVCFSGSFRVERLGLHREVGERKWKLSGTYGLRKPSSAARANQALIWY